ncbi:Four helix bundle sensory module for signal transduction [Andreprevotia lacus DSM 23236]|jgi:methyl-accepting chemotaxis protein|uniref:Four helix bundle sensory module for signal transduction n=1 Tax=Andreprevotia lacus DSM 23236 TaxID=1121001 RepID=A0A1W1XU56_9NEIS|nr:MCP four helix bundle domain-containing protein [Andreprevotia lacus]SMC27493.1 Four helix bundle sensory module for signal transduction [Andreprevotia lacus DSM 23236]
MKKSLLRLSLGQRLAAGFAAVIVLLGAVSAYSWHTMNTLQAQLNDAVGSSSRRLETVHQLKEAVLAEEGHLLALMLADQPAKARVLTEQLDGAHRRVTELGRQLAELETGGAPRDLQLALGGYNSEIAQIREMLDIEDRYGANTEVNIELRQRRTALFGVLDHMLAARGAQLQQAMQSSNASVSAARLWLVVLGATAAVIALFTGWRITRTVMREVGVDLNAAVDLAADLANGKLKLSMRRADFGAGSVMDSLLAMRDRMMDGWRYRKTAAGNAALTARDKLVDGRARQLLVLIDGQRALSALIEVFGETAWAQLRELEAMGFITRADGMAAPVDVPVEAVMQAFEPELVPEPA